MSKQIFEKLISLRNAADNALKNTDRYQAEDAYGQFYYAQDDEVRLAWESVRGEEIPSFEEFNQKLSHEHGRSNRKLLNLLSKGLAI